MVLSAEPKIEGLTTDDYLTFAKEKSSLLKFLPDDEDCFYIKRSGYVMFSYSRHRSVQLDG